MNDPYEEEGFYRDWDEIQLIQDWLYEHLKRRIPYTDRYQRMGYMTGLAIRIWDMRVRKRLRQQDFRP